MKKLNYVAVLAVVFIFTAVAANATGVKNELNEYEITPVEDLHMGKNVKGIWTLSYSKDEAPVTVVKRKTVDGIEYVVQSNYFAVSYASTVKGFGAKEVRKAWTNVPRKISKAVINGEELARQEIITPNKVDDKMALGLIASYLPDLLNDSYTHLLN